MTLNVIKWVYDLGVRHERERIAGQLRNIQAQHAAGMATSVRPRLIEADEDEWRKKERLKFQAAVGQEVHYIIEDIFKADFTASLPSIMYPEE